LGIAGATLLTSIVSGAMVLHERDVVSAECGSDGGCSSRGLSAADAGRTWLVVNDAAWIATAAAAGLGVALVILGRDSVRGHVVSVGPGSVLLTHSF
jgi:hypothetical protein